MSRIVRVLCAALLVTLVVGAIVPTLAPANASAQSPVPEKKKVLTTFTILADMARNVAGDKLDVQSITKVGAEIHDYEPTPSDIARADDADLLLTNGLGLERWFERFYNNLDDVPVADLSEGVDPIQITEGPYQDSPNPHAWMSPKNGAIYVENIRKAFVQLDPANAEYYNANAAAYTEQLMDIDQQLSAAVSAIPEEQRYLVSCEGAFTYLIRDYGLKELYLWPINAESEGTPQQIAKVVDGVKANHIPVVFCESTVNPNAQKQVANETGASYGGFLYVDSLTDADGDAPTYLQLLQFDVDTLINGWTRQ